MQQPASQSAAILHALRGSNTRPGQLKTTPRLGGIAPCYRCGGQHKASDCRFKDEKCRYCGKKGHIVRACRTRIRAQCRPASSASSHDARNICTEEPPKEDTANPVYEMFPLTAPKPDPLRVFVRVELPMEIDTGASISIISEKTYLSTWTDELHPRLLPTKACLRT